MLFISRKFTLGVNAKDAETIEEKLKEVSILYDGPHYHGHHYENGIHVKAYFECTASEKEMDTLKEYLQNDFKGIASIIL